VRTAAIPQPMSTPTAAGMIAPNVGMTEPTVEPLPRWASGIRATCGKMNGIEDVFSACSRVLGSRIDAQFINRLLNFSTTSLLLPARGNVELGAQRAPGVPRLDARLERLRRRLPPECTENMTGDQHVTSSLPELGQHQFAELCQAHASTVEVIETDAEPATVVA